MQEDENKWVEDSIFGTFATSELRIETVILICGKVWKRRRPHLFAMKRDAALGKLWRVPGLEVKLQSELKNARIANGAGKDSERGRPECSVGGGEVRMIEHVEGLRTEREAEFFREGEFLAEIHVPVLLEGSAVNVPAEIAEERATVAAYREGLIARAA